MFCMDTGISPATATDFNWFFQNPGDIFEATLNKVDEKYGSLRNYLTACLGVTPEMMNVLRDRYLE